MSVFEWVGLLVVGAILLCILGYLVFLLSSYLMYGTVNTMEQTRRMYDLEMGRLEQSGISESERAFVMLARRPGWQTLPKEFLREITTRLSSKEDVVRFIVISEAHRLERTHFPRIAADSSPEHAAFSVAMLLGSLGNKLLGEGQLGDAENAQSLALRLQPDNPGTMLPLAATYYTTGRYAEAIPLFERGLPLFSSEQEKSDKLFDFFEHFPAIPREELFGSPSDMVQLEQVYREMYEDCLRHVGSPESD